MSAETRRERERVKEAGRRVVHKLSEWYFAQGGDESPDAPFDRADLDVLHEVLDALEPGRPEAGGNACQACGDPAEWGVHLGPLDAGLDIRLCGHHRDALQCRPTPADVRERVKGAWATVEAAALAQADVLDSHYGGQPAKAAEIRNAVEQVAALLRTPRGGDPVALRLAASKLEASGYDVLALRLRQIADQIKCVIAARRSKAHGEDRWEDVVFGPITEAYNEAHAAHLGEGGGDGLE